MPEKSKVDTTIYVEPAPKPAQGWTPSRLRVAERLADQGDISLAADLSELILADDNVSGLVSTLGAVVSLPLTFGPQGDEESNEVTEALDKDWFRFLPEDLATEVIGWLRVLGVAFVHVRSWGLDEESGRVLPQLEVWHPRSFRFDWQSRQWMVRLGLGKELPITPGDGRWLVFSLSGSRPWAKAPWRSLSRWWLLKQYAISDWGFHSNRHGSGLLVASNTAATVSATPQARAELARDLQSIGRNGSVALPDGFDLALLEATARTWDTFVRQIEMSDGGAAIALTGNNLSSKVEGGSFAAATVHERVTQSRIRSIAESLSTTIRTQLLVWYVEFNFGVRNRTPWPKWNTSPPSDQPGRASVFAQVATAIATLDSRGYSIDPEVLEQEFGFKIERTGEPDPNPGFGAGPQEDPDEDLDPEDDEELAVTRLNTRAALRQRAVTADDQFAQDLADAGSQAGAESLAPHIDELLDIIEGADKPADLYRALAEYYADLDPEDFATVTERASLLANLRGRRAAIREV